jgi:hypothetical protein
MTGALSLIPVAMRTWRSSWQCPRDAQRDASNESIGFTGCLPALARRVAATFTGVQDHHDPALKTNPEPLHVRVNLVAHPVGFLKSLRTRMISNPGGKPCRACPQRIGIAP